MCDMPLSRGMRLRALLGLAGCLLAFGRPVVPSGNQADLAALVARVEHADPADESYAERKATRAALRDARSLLATVRTGDLRRRFYLAAVKEDIANCDYDQGVSDLEALVPLTSGAERTAKQRQLEEMKVVRDKYHQAVLAQPGHYDAKAASILQRIVDDHPGYVWPDLIRTLCGMYQQTGQRSRAVATLERAMRLYKGKWAGRLAAGDLAAEYRTENRPEKALILLQELLRSTPRDESLFSAHFGLAECYVLMGKKPEALREIELARNAADSYGYRAPVQKERTMQVLARVEARARALK